MCNLYSITTNQQAIIELFRGINRYVGNLPPMPGVFPDYPAPVIRNTDTGRELVMMPCLGHATTPEDGRRAGHQYPQHVIAAPARLAEGEEPLPRPGELRRVEVRRFKESRGFEFCITPRTSPI